MFRRMGITFRRMGMVLFLVGSLGFATAEAGPPPARLQNPSVAEAARRYRWHRRRLGYDPLSHRVAAPAGYRRVSLAPKSYGRWLRHLPLLPPGSPVRSYRGRVIHPAGAQGILAVVDLDVGTRDRQQCVDTIMRLRGEYLYGRGRANRVAFAWAGGKRFGYAQWRRGLRPVKEGRRWRFVARSRKWSGYRSFRHYLGYMFSWTGTIHQLGERRVKAAALRVGDFFIHAGSPGHAVVILDLAVAATGGRVVLLGQGFMPAQDLHVIRGPEAGWFLLGPRLQLSSALWPGTFTWKDLRRFRN